MTERSETPSLRHHVLLFAQACAGVLVLLVGALELVRIMTDWLPSRMSLTVLPALVAVALVANDWAKRVGREPTTREVLTVTVLATLAALLIFIAFSFIASQMPPLAHYDILKTIVAGGQRYGGPLVALALFALVQFAALLFLFPSLTRSFLKQRKTAADKAK